MKLSDAIELGFNKVKVQAFGHYFDMHRDIDANGQHSIIGACALGCAYIGLHPEAVAAAPNSLDVSNELMSMWSEQDQDGTLAKVAMWNDSYTSVYDIVARLRGVGL